MFFGFFIRWCALHALGAFGFNERIRFSGGLSVTNTCTGARIFPTMFSFGEQEAKEKLRASLSPTQPDAAAVE